MPFLRGEPDGEPDLAGYTVLIRRTTAPDWERKINVGNVTAYRLPNGSIDELVFGIRVVDISGMASIVSAYLLPTAPRVAPE